MMITILQTITMLIKVRMVIHQTRVMKMNMRRFVMFVDDLKVKQEL